MQNFQILFLPQVEVSIFYMRFYRYRVQKTHSDPASPQRVSSRVRDAGFNPENAASTISKYIKLLLDYRLRNDPGRVRQLLESSRAVSYKDLTMLKLVLTSGLYPQFAVADEFNSYKAGQDQLFHTRVKPFNVLHPNCIFARPVSAVHRTKFVYIPTYLTS